MSRQPDPWRSLREELSKIKETLRRMQSASPFFGTGMHPNGNGGIDSDNFEAGVSGYSFKDDGSLEINDITLRGGIIGNDALTNPVRGDVMLAAVSNFALSTTMSALASQTWYLPAGFTQVSVDVTAKVFAYNGTAGLDYLYARPRIVRVSDGAEVTSNATPTAVSGSNGSGTSLSRGVAVIGLGAGDGVRIDVQGSTAFASWAANAGNYAEVSGSLTWYRPTT